MSILLVGSFEVIYEIDTLILIAVFLNGECFNTFLFEAGKPKIIWRP